jgi:hypothetical protein
MNAYSRQDLNDKKRCCSLALLFSSEEATDAAHRFYWLPTTYDHPLLLSDRNIPKELPKISFETFKMKRDRRAATNQKTILPVSQTM